MEFYKPAQSDTASTVAEGYDNNFKALDAAVTDLETEASDQSRQLGALRDDVALKAYTTEVDAKDTATLTTSKAYADQLIEALREGAPETLDTLRKLAAALGDDPAFSTTVMQMIGDRVTTEALNKALAEYLPLIGGTLTGGVDIDRDLGITAGFSVDTGGAYMLVAVGGKQAGILYLNANGLTYVDNENRRNTLWHSGNHGAGSGLDADLWRGVQLWRGTKAQYDAIATKDNNTLYIVTE